MSGFRHSMIMFALVVIIGRVSPPDESQLWTVVGAAWFIIMIISLVRELILYGKKQDTKNPK